MTDYCKHLHWFTSVEGYGDYYCGLGNKTSSEWCEKNERCSDWISNKLFDKSLCDERIMVDKPNCSTCPKEHTKKCPIDFEKSNGNSDIFNGIRRVTDNCVMGCHPKAREWLIWDEMRELEKRIKIWSSPIPGIIIEQQTHDDTIARTYKEAILLMRNGVEKK